MAAAIALALFATGCIVDPDDQPATDPEPIQGDNACAAKFVAPDAAGRHSWEKLTLRVSGQRFRIGFPLPVAEPQTDVASWVKNASVQRGQASFEVAVKDGRTILMVAGQDQTTICSTSLQFPYLGNRCCAEAFIHATWSTVDERRAQENRVWIEDGPVNVEILYDADSDYCWRDASFAGSRLGPGWVSLRGEDGTSCA